MTVALVWEDTTVFFYGSFVLELSAKTLWPLFPLLLLVVVVCLTWALVIVVRHKKVRTAPRAIGFGLPINYAKEQWAVWIPVVSCLHALYADYY